MHKRLFQQGTPNNYLADEFFDCPQDAHGLFARFYPVHCLQSRNIRMPSLTVVVGRGMRPTSCRSDDCAQGLRLHRITLREVIRAFD
jgi:hypothetical protein